MSDYADDQHPATPPNVTADPANPGPFADAFIHQLRSPANPQSPHPSGPPVGGASPFPHDALPPAPDPDVAAELALLKQIRDAGLGSPVNLVVTEYAPPSVTEVDHPVPGVKRWLLPRVAAGGQIEVPEGGWTSVVAGDRSRLGGSVVNSGTQAIVLGLAKPTDINAVTGKIYLASEGGSWDLKLAGITWAGSISAITLGTAGQLQVVTL